MTREEKKLYNKFYKLHSIVISKIKTEDDAPKVEILCSQIDDVTDELTKLPDHGQAVYEALIRDGCPSLRCWAAARMLHVDERRAREVLSEVASGIYGGASANAKMALWLWEEGKLKIKNAYGYLE